MVIQLAAYQIEADLIGFDGIPQLTETAEHVRTLTDMQWRGMFDGGLLLGIIAWDERDGEVDIDRLAVHPDAARRGYGRALVQSVPQDRHTIVSTGAANRPAVSLYEKEGFVRTSETEIAPGVFLAHFERPPSGAV